eukprot:gnl/Dysnectes_brevis/467_a520_2786.p1 GENE.gnl/Dysnectes_brevis/467_a520_2786~~gnl/Dysnectes_brevis/467_a520_2786.p1  ORF type:complete len:394 (-),score=93.73 gnl/Dysnectes_brevis/467_a520_2786:919-2100(-)
MKSKKYEKEMPPKKKTRRKQPSYPTLKDTSIEKDDQDDISSESDQFADPATFSAQYSSDDYVDLLSAYKQLFKIRETKPERALKLISRKSTETSKAYEQFVSHSERTISSLQDQLKAIEASAKAKAKQRVGQELKQQKELIKQQKEQLKEQSAQLKDLQKQLKRESEAYKKQSREIQRAAHMRAESDEQLEQLNAQLEQAKEQIASLTLSYNQRLEETSKLRRSITPTRGQQNLQLRVTDLEDTVVRMVKEAGVYQHLLSGRVDLVVPEERSQDIATGAAVDQQHSVDRYVLSIGKNDDAFIADITFYQEEPEAEAEAEAADESAAAVASTPQDVFDISVQSFHSLMDSELQEQLSNADDLRGLPVEQAPLILQQLLANIYPAEEESEEEEDD